MKCVICEVHKESVIVCKDGVKRCRSCLRAMGEMRDPDKHSYDWAATTKEKRKKWE